MGDSYRRPGDRRIFNKRQTLISQDPNNKLFVIASMDKSWKKHWSVAPPYTVALPPYTHITTQAIILDQGTAECLSSPLEC